MKKIVIKKACKEIISISLVPLLLVCIILLFANSDRFVTYDIDSSKAYGHISKNTGAKQASAAIENQESCALSLLPEGKYSIMCSGEEICVYDDDGEMVCVLDAYLSEFPENDRLVLVEGIHSLSKNELLEIAEYLES